MKKHFIFIVASILILLSLNSGLASDLLQEKNTSASNVISTDLPLQNITPVLGDTNQCLDKTKLESKSTELARRGCCSHHGGVCGCDQTTDRIKCCDGTLSPSCTCSGY
jgi:hypothetical protein